MSEYVCCEKERWRLTTTFTMPGQGNVVEFKRLSDLPNASIRRLLLQLIIGLDW